MGLEDPIDAGSGPAADRVQIISQLWHDATVEVKDASLWEAYFAYYEDECKKAMEHGGDHVTVRKHQDVVDIAVALQTGATKSNQKQALALTVKRHVDDQVKDDMAEGSLRLAVRLLSMTDFGPPSARIRSYEFLAWDDGLQTLKDRLEQYYRAGTSTAKSSQFDQYFSACNVERFTEIRVEWTDNLADHLRLVNYGETLWIYHHATFLRGHKSNIFPKGLLEETLRTLALLFPYKDRSTTQWVYNQFRLQRESKCIDLELLNCEPLLAEERQIEKFKFWRDRLVVLKERYENPRPKKLSQFWHDDRNKVQWYTFWVAILVLFLTIFFGLVQSIEGAMQVYKAYHPTPG